MKKIISALLIISLTGMNFLPAFAKGEVKTSSKKEAKTQKARTVRLNYINLDWWEDYDDPYLTEYILKAFENNQDLKITTLQTEESKQRTRLQLAKELPNLSVGVSPILYKLPGVNSTDGAFAVPILANYEIDLFLKNRDKTRSSKKAYEADKIRERAAYIAIASAVGSTYYNIVKLDKLIELQQDLIKDRENIYQLMKMSNEVGIVSTADLTKADKARTSAKADMYDLKKNRIALLNSLAVLTGDSPNNIEEFKRISYDEITKEKPIPKEISSQIITQRPDYLVAEKMVEKAGIDVRVAKKEFLPNLNIIGLFTFLSDSNNTSMNWNNTIAALAGSAMLQLFSGGSKIANLKINKLRYEQILQDYYKTNLTAIKEVNDSLSGLKLDNEKYLTNKRTLAMEEKDFGYTQSQYDAGVSSYLDLLQKRENLISVKKLVTSSKIDCQIDQISLYKAVGASKI